jgi:tetratricopeptide (TPR) repeat protein
MKPTAAITLVVLLAAALPGTAQDPVSLEIDAILVQAAELPRTIKFVEGMPSVSRQPRSYFETPDAEKLAGGNPVPEAVKAACPKPTRKECQSFAAEGGKPGSVFLFEYAEADREIARTFLRSYLWGGRGRSAEHPEEIITRGNLVWILSFPQAASAAEWYKARLRKKFRVPALRAHPELTPLGKKLVAAFRARNADQGLAALEEDANAAHGWAFAQYFLGEFAVKKQDWPTAERGYRRAIELHETLEDPLPQGLFWNALDGLGMALLYQRRLDDAVPVLVRAKDLSSEAGPRKGAKSAYNLACTYALLERWAEALAALEDAIAGNPRYRTSARTDEDLAEARKREEFRALLKEPEAG